MAAREWDVPKPAYRWQQNRQKFLSDRLQIDARPQCRSLCSANSDVIWLKWYVWGSNLNLLAISGLCNCEYSHQTLKQWLHQTVKMSASPLSASAAATFREKAGPVQLFSASPRSLPSATFGGDFYCFGVRQGRKFSIFAECRGVTAADATFSAPNGIVCGRLRKPQNGR